MKISDIPFGTTDWDAVGATDHAGETGVATWRTRRFGDVRVRRVEYPPGYRSLFAQHLGAAGPVSVQRIRKVLGSELP